MSDALATALAPLTDAVNQEHQDLLNIGTLETAAFTQLETQIATLGSQVASGGTISAADVLTIQNNVSVLAQSHTLSQTIIANLGSITNPGTIANTGT